MTKTVASRLKRCLTFLLAMLLLLSLVPFQALATETSDSNVAKYTITGSFEGKFELSSDKYQLFHLNDIVPGDKWTGQIHIKNAAEDSMTVSLLTIASDMRDTRLFNALTLDISHKGKSLYSGSYNTGMNPITTEFVVRPGKTVVLDVEVELPLKTGNEVQGREMVSTWTFEAKYKNKPQTGRDLISENSMNLYALWILIFALIATAIVTLRIRSVKKMRNEQSKEVNRQ